MKKRLRLILIVMLVCGFGAAGYHVFSLWQRNKTRTELEQSGQVKVTSTSTCIFSKWIERRVGDYLPEFCYRPEAHDITITDPSLIETLPQLYDVSKLRALRVLGKSGNKEPLDLDGLHLYPELAFLGLGDFPLSEQALANLNKVPHLSMFYALPDSAGPSRPPQPFAAVEDGARLTGAAASEEWLRANAHRVVGHAAATRYEPKFLSMERLWSLATEVPSIHQIRIEGNFTLSGSTYEITDERIARVNQPLKLVEFNYLFPLAISDTGAAKLKYFTEMSSLNLSGTTVTDAGLPHVAEMKSLNRLELPDHGYTAAGMQPLAKLEKLEALKVRNVDFTGEFFSALPKTTLLKELELTE
ncbi:MAG: hypothetical protein CMJ46_13470, partial [Planctomyces sp.]|nr:hypothetical protein [Planctomyces sp.]